MIDRVKHSPLNSPSVTVRNSIVPFYYGLTLENSQSYDFDFDFNFDNNCKSPLKLHKESHQLHNTIDIEMTIIKQ